MKIKTLEKKRYSILTDHLEWCYLCGKPKQHLHEVYFGANRVNSMKYGCVVPLCAMCHNKVHHDIQVDTKLKQEMEEKFLEVYNCSVEDFISVFRRNYLP